MRPRGFLGVAAAGFAVLLLLDLASIAFRTPISVGWVARTQNVLLFSNEASFPMFFNYALLLANVVFLLVATARAFGLRDPWRGAWLGAAAVFVFLAYDEATQFHSALIPVARSFLLSRDALLVAVVIACLVLALGAAMALVGFLLALPRRSAARFVVAGGLYVAGAVGFDLAASDYATNAAKATTGFLLLGTAEEGLELIGLILFGYALLRHLARPDGRVGITIDV